MWFYVICCEVRWRLGGEAASLTPPWPAHPPTAGTPLASHPQHSQPLCPPPHRPCSTPPHLWDRVVLMNGVQSLISNLARSDDSFHLLLSLPAAWESFASWQPPSTSSCQHVLLLGHPTPRGRRLGRRWHTRTACCRGTWSKADPKQWPAWVYSQCRLYPPMKGQAWKNESEKQLLNSATSFNNPAKCFYPIQDGPDVLTQSLFLQLARR